MKKNFLFIYFIVIGSVVSACGQKGPLVLPEKQFIIKENSESEKNN